MPSQPNVSLPSTTFRTLVLFLTSSVRKQRKGEPTLFCATRVCPSYCAFVILSLTIMCVLLTYHTHNGYDAHSTWNNYVAYFLDIAIITTLNLKGIVIRVCVVEYLVCVVILVCVVACHVRVVEFHVRFQHPQLYRSTPSTTFKTEKAL